MLAARRPVRSIEGSVALEPQRKSAPAPRIRRTGKSAIHAQHRVGAAHGVLLHDGVPAPREKIQGIRRQPAFDSQLIGQPLVMDPRRGDPGRLSAGEWVIATGNPFFLASDGQPVVTLGVVSTACLIAILLEDSVEFLYFQF